jgi:hypothetical protein
VGKRQRAHGATPPCTEGKRKTTTDYKEKQQTEEEGKRTARENGDGHKERTGEERGKTANRKGRREGLGNNTAQERTQARV